jgi:hypothetical protein
LRYFLFFKVNSKGARDGEPDGQRLDRVQHMIHHAISAHRRVRGAWMPVCIGWPAKEPVRVRDALAPAMMRSSC